MESEGAPRLTSEYVCGYSRCAPEERQLSNTGMSGFRQALGRVIYVFCLVCVPSRLP